MNKNAWVGYSVWPNLPLVRQAGMLEGVGGSGTPNAACAFFAGTLVVDSPTGTHVAEVRLPTPREQPAGT